MIERSSSTMPKTAFFICFLFCGNIIPSGKTAEQCPKNPLSPTNSVSGIVVGTIVGAEKLVNGVMMYFYYLGENSANQVITLTSKLGDVVTKYTIKIQDFASGLLGSIGGQVVSIYNGSAGSIRVLFDYVIKMENSVQSFVYKQVNKLSDEVVSGKITGDLSEIVKSPVRSVSSGFKKTKELAAKITGSFQSDIKKVVDTVKTSGVPSDVKDILGSPIRGVKIFVKESESAIAAVKNETTAKFKSYIIDFQSGGIINKLVAISSFPVGITTESWSLTLKLSGAVKTSISQSVKDVVQPFLGQTLTERLGKIVNLPMDLTEGVYKSTINTFSQVGGVIAKVTGGGSVSDQINNVMMHPLTIVENAWNTTKQEVKDFSKASLGAELTEQLGSVLGSPGKAISSVLSSITNGQVTLQLGSLIDAPMMYVQKIWSQTKMTVYGITKGIIGEKYTDKISEVLSSPGKFISDSISSITGGGSISVQIQSVFSQPLQTIKNLASTVKTKTGELVSSITGGGSLSVQLSSLFTEPVTLVKNIWSSTTQSIKSVSKSLIGENLTQSIGTAFSSPMETVKNLTASITGGGNLSAQLKMVVTKPFDVVKSVWETTKSKTESLTKTLLGDNTKQFITSLFTSPVQSISKLSSSIVSSVKGLFGSFGASVSISADGSGGGGGSISGGIKSIIQAPLDVLKGTFNGLSSAQKSLIGGVKGLFSSIPIIGKGSINIKLKEGNQKSEINIGAGGKGQAKSGGKASVQAGGSAEGGGS